MHISDIERQFLLSILENLDNKVNFLIYADWLEENNGNIFLVEHIRSCFGDMNSFHIGELWLYLKIIAQFYGYKVVNFIYRENCNNFIYRENYNRIYEKGKKWKRSWWYFNGCNFVYYKEKDLVNNISIPKGRYEHEQNLSKTHSSLLKLAIINYLIDKTK